MPQSVNAVGQLKANRLKEKMWRCGQKWGERSERDRYKAGKRAGQRGSLDWHATVFGITVNSIKAKGGRIMREI